jgi:hypothetical protein
MSEDGVARWSNADLEEAWAAALPSIPEPFQSSMGVTHHPEDDRPWVAWCGTGDQPIRWGAEGWGDTPVRAIRALAEAFERDLGWWQIDDANESGRGPLAPGA